MANIIQTFPNGAGGGHEVLENGVAVPQEKKLDFCGVSVSDDLTNEKTVIEGVGLNQDSLDDVAGASLPGTILAGSGFNYSTSEQIIGRWIDGKPLYQKTLIMSDSYTSEIHVPNNATGVSVTGITDIFMSTIKPTLDKMVYTEMDTNDRVYSGSSYHHSYPYRFNKDNGNIAVVDNYMVGYQENIALYPGTSFTFRYTKTTD